MFTVSDDDAAAAALEARGVGVIRFPGQGRLPLTEVLRELGEREVNEIWVEAGASLSGALLREELVDEVIIYLAPHLLGTAARGMFAMDELTEMAQRVELVWQDVRRVGDNLRLRLARPPLKRAEQP